MIVTTFIVCLGFGLHRLVLFFDMFLWVWIASSIEVRPLTLAGHNNNTLYLQLVARFNGTASCNGHHTHQLGPTAASEPSSAPVWYKFFLNNEYVSLFSSLTMVLLRS
ncbi:hypothetical protein Leryth_023527 [Lithospermum erythrorhizon]|nr:hypothetical protein Leryth_023527 [Lithospermum erythrorhizon]